MTSVPKPLKFLRPFYADLEGVRATWPDNLKSEKVSPPLPFSSDELVISSLTFQRES